MDINMALNRKDAGRAKDDSFFYVLTFISLR